MFYKTTVGELIDNGEGLLVKVEGNHMEDFESIMNYIMDNTVVSEEALRDNLVSLAENPLRLRFNSYLNYKKIAKSKFKSDKYCNGNESLIIFLREAISSIIDIIKTTPPHEIQKEGDTNAYELRQIGLNMSQQIQLDISLLDIDRIIEEVVKN